MKMKKLGVGLGGLTLLAGSAVGIGLSSGIASADGSAPTTPAAATIMGTSLQIDSGANVQWGDQSGSQSNAPDPTEAASSEVSSEATSTETKVLAGAQDIGGANIDSQSTGGQ